MYEVGHASETIGDSLYRTIRTDIVVGRLPAAQKLKLEQLKIRYGASISTLREILNRLTSDGLVVAEGQRGFVVAPMSPADLREVAALRQLLECQALELSLGAGDIDWEARVVAAHHKLAQMESGMTVDVDGQSELWKRYDCQFHRALISACGSTVLMEVHGSVFNRYLRYQMSAKGYREATAREHRMLLDAALNRDAGTACAVLIDHIAGGVDYALVGGGSS